MPRIDRDELESFVTRIVKQLGTDDETATEVAESLVEADLRGHSSHGVRQLATKYVPEIEEGKIDPSATPVLEQIGPSQLIIDSQKAFGQAVGREAVDAVVSAAEASEVGVVGIRNVSHLGRIGEWAERVTDRGFAFIAFVCNPASRYVAPAGSAEARLSTNPITIGVPTFDAIEFPIVLDIATSQVAYGKTRMFRTNDKPIPEGLAVTSSGDPLTDPERLREGDGALLPLGGLVSGYKGFGLAVVAELLAANLGDGSISGEVDPIWGNHAGFFAVDLTRFTTRDRLEERISAFAAYLRDTSSAPFSPGVAAKGDEPLLPGEAEYRKLEEQRESGIFVSEEDARLLVALARDRGVEDAVPANLRD